MITSSDLINKTVYLEVRTSRVIFILPLIGYTAGFLMGVSLALHDRPGSWIFVIVFGLCMIFYIWQILDRRPHIVIDDSGILIRFLGVGKILWEDIESVSAHKASSREIDLDLNLRNEEKYLERLSFLKKALVRPNEKKGYTFSLRCKNLTVDADEILHLIMSKA